MRRSYAGAGFAVRVSRLFEDDGSEVSLVDAVGSAIIQARAAAGAAGPGRRGDVFPPIDYGAPAAGADGAAGQGGVSAAVAASGDKRIDGLLTGLRWSGGAITYTDPDAADDYQPGYGFDTNRNGVSAQNEGFSRISADQLYTVQYALDTASITQPAGARGLSVEGFTALDISYGPPASGTGTIRVANTADNNYGYAFYPAGSIYGGDVWLGTALRTPAQGNYGWNNTLHELGHALGLKHGQETGGPGNTALPTEVDSLEFTVMTYRSYVGAPLNGYTNTQWSYPQTFMMLDVAALQYMYGADFTSNAGDTVYTWSQTSGQSFVNGALATNPGANKVFMTIWDGGGVDTYDLGSYTTALSVDLSPGGWSTFDTAQLAELGSSRAARGNLANTLLYQDDSRSLIDNAIGGSGNDAIVGNRIANMLTGSGGDDALSGVAGDDALVGGAGVDVLDGGEGNDLLDGGAGRDDLRGGIGVDTASYAAQDYAVGAALAPGYAFLLENDLLDGVEHLIGSGFDDQLIGSDDDNVIEGGAGDDYLVGLGGIDTASYASAGAGVRVDLRRVDIAQDSGGAGSDRLSAFENLAGSAFADRLTGDAGDNRLDGGLGADRLVGGAGADTFIVDDAGDRTIERGEGGDDIVMAAIDWTLESETERLLLTGNASINGNGNAVANRIAGNEADNRLDGRGGDDTLVGGDGNDKLTGGLGVDSLAGGAGDDIVYVDDLGDTVIEAVDAGYDSVSSGVAYVLGDHVEKLILTGAARLGTGNALDNAIIGSGGGDALKGLGGKDTISGGAGADTIDGGNGADIVTGGQGRDTLTGGDDADRFVFRAGDTGATVNTADRIVDFDQASDDRIVLTAIDADAATPGDDAFVFIGTAAFSNVAGQLRYDAVGGDTMIYGDIDGNGTADLAIRLTGSVAIAATDFAL